MSNEAVKGPILFEGHSLPATGGRKLTELNNY